MILILLATSAESRFSYRGMILKLVRVQGFLPRHGPNTVTWAWSKFSYQGMILIPSAESRISYRGMILILLATSAESRISYLGMILILRPGHGPEP
jgi:hypothetical protein